MRTHVEFFVSDFERSIAFYQTLGFEVVRKWEGWALLDRAGARLALQDEAYARSHDHYFTHNLDGPRGVGVEVPIEVGDLEAAYEAASALGTAVVKGITERPWGARDFRVADPDGYFLRFTTPLKGE
jgi:catechol 2,3-dioxygenase-like lactoylglutathione lyase family enzyme